MTNNGAVAKTMTANGSYTIPAGYHNGSGKVTVNVSSSSGSSNNNVEAYAITNTNPSVSFKRTDGAIKIWGYGTMTSSGGWGQQTTSLVAFEGRQVPQGRYIWQPKQYQFEPKHQQRKTDWPAEWTDGDQRDCNKRYMIWQHKQTD